MNMKTFSLAMLTAAAFAVPGLAHHSFSMFDAEKTVTLNGTVKELEWTNPHSWLRIMVVDQASHTARRGLVVRPPTRQQPRSWWTEELDRPGDEEAKGVDPGRDRTRGG